MVAQIGQNAVIKTTGGATTNSPSFFDATQFIGTGDPCQAIAATFAALPSTGGTVDARGLISGTSTTLICSVNPIPSTAKGRLLLSSGTYLAQVPWVIQSNDFNIIGTGGTDNSGSNNTIIQACASSQASLCNSNVFPSGQGVIQMGTSSKTVFRSTVKELGVDCQGVPGVSGFQVIAAQEETVFDLVKATGCPVAGFDLGVGDTAIQDGAALSNFEANYTNGIGCPTVTAGTLSGATRDSSGIVTATVSAAPSPTLVVGNEVVIAGFSNPSFNGTYRVNSIIGPPPLTFTYQTSVAGGTTSGTGRVSPYPVGVRVWQASGSPVRPIINGTVNGSDCGYRPPIAMDLSGGFPFVHNVHTEGFAVGVQIGDLSGTNGATLTNLKLENKTTTGIVISNQWITAGSAPMALPSGNIDIFDLDTTGGSPPVTDSILDLINGNTLTLSGGERKRCLLSVWAEWRHNQRGTGERTAKCL